MKALGWILVALGIVLVPVAFILNATFASTRAIDDAIGVYTHLTGTGSIVPLIVAGLSAVLVIAGIVLIIRGGVQTRALAAARAAEGPRTIPPGWYPHGNVQRYWDGTIWTDDTAPLA